KDSWIENASSSIMNGDLLPISVHPCRMAGKRQGSNAQAAAPPPIDLFARGRRQSRNLVTPVAAPLPFRASIAQEPRRSSHRSESTHWPSQDRRRPPINKLQVLEPWELDVATNCA